MKASIFWISALALLLAISFTSFGAEPPRSDSSVPTQPIPREAPPWGHARPPMSPTPLRLIAAIDVDRDGQLSDGEMSEIPNALTKLDLNNDRQLDSTELGWWPQPHQGLPPWRGARPRTAFDHRSPTPEGFAQSFLKHDTDGSGGVSATELPESFRFLVPGLVGDGGGEVDRSDLVRFEMFIAMEADGQQLRGALLAGEPLSPETLGRLREVLDACERTETVNEAQIASVRRSEWYSYAFTVAAMLIGTISFGHLLTAPPSRHTRWTESDAAPDATRPVLISLGLICILSLIDLLWTTVRSSSFHFQEMNPLGFQLLLDGSSPLAFKATTLAVSVILLFVLRRYHAAQLASWWMCMVCTLLTFRWIVLDSAILS